MQKYRAMSFKIWESTNYNMGMRIPEQVDLDSEELDIIKDLKWTDLYWSEIGNDGGKIIWLEMSIPIDLDISKGIIVDVQIVKSEFYQIHISLAESLRGIGLGTKIYRSLINNLGHLYSDKDRLKNPIISKVWDDLKNDWCVTCDSNDEGEICVSNNNPNKDLFLSIFNDL